MNNENTTKSITGLQTNEVLTSIEEYQLLELDVRCLSE